MPPLNIKIEGLDQLRGNLRVIQECAPLQLGIALRDELDIVGEDSYKVCPYDQDNPHDDGTPHLRDTLSVVGPETDDNSVSCTISYDTPYAIIQHEVQEYHHDIPEQWKYLEMPLNARVKYLMPDLMEAVQDYLQGRQYVGRTMDQIQADQEAQGEINRMQRAFYNAQKKYGHLGGRFL